MGDLIVRPSYQLSERDILTVDKLNLMATPVVELSLEDPVNDQNFFRNGNFYSGFWITPAGVTCPIGVATENANFYFCTPQGDTVNYARDTAVPDDFSLWSVKLTGNTNTAIVEFGSRIVADLAATLRRNCTFACYIWNNTGLLLSPQLNFYTCNSFNDFANVTLVDTVDLPSIGVGLWGYEPATEDLSTLPNITNGLYITVVFPSGSLNGTSKSVNISRFKFQIGEVATPFADDATLFDETPSIGANDLQDGCIARPTLFLPKVIPPGTYEDKSIEEGDIDDKAIDNRTLADGSVDTRVLADGGVTLQKLAAAVITYLLPPGTIWPYAGTTIPTDWLECNGAALSRTDPNYAPLYAAIGVTWGPGDGITTFNLPDFRGLSLTGAGVNGRLAGLTNRLLGQIFGEESHQLVVTEVPVHNHVATVNEAPHGHNYTDGQHTHNYSQWHDKISGANCAAGSNVFMNAETAATTPNSPLNITITPNKTNLTVAISNAGGSGKHNNMQPTAVVRWMIKL